MPYPNDAQMIIPTIHLSHNLITTLRTAFESSAVLYPYGSLVDPDKRPLGIEASGTPHGKAVVHNDSAFPIVRTTTTPSYLMFTLDPRLEGWGGPSLDLHRLGIFEPELMSRIAADVREMCRQGRLFIDVGVNVGSYALFAASMGCKVLGFETNADLRELVRNSAALNDFESKVHVLPYGAGPHREKVFVNNFKTCPACSSITTRDDPQAVVVDVVDISSHVFESPAFMKIDIDGYEVGALEGALRFMRERDLPHGYVEFTPHWWHRGEGISLDRGINVMKEISKMGYSFSHLNGHPYPLREIISGILSSQADAMEMDANIYFSKIHNPNDA